MAHRSVAGSIERRRRAACLETLESIMGMILWWRGLDRLWKELRPYLVRRLAGRPTTLMESFKGSLEPTVGEITQAIIDHFRATEIPLHWSTDRVRRITASGEKTVLTVRSFPLSRLSESSILHEAVVAKLRDRVDLEAARKESGLVDDEEWQSLIGGYAAELLRYGAEVALRRMVARGVTIWAGYVALAIEKREVYSINHYLTKSDMLKLYDPPVAYHLNKPGLSGARRIWGRRRSPGYRYDKGRYQDQGVPGETDATRDGRWRSHGGGRSGD